MKYSSVNEAKGILKEVQAPEEKQKLKLLKTVAICWLSEVIQLIYYCQDFFDG